MTSFELTEQEKSAVFLAFRDRITYLKTVVYSYKQVKPSLAKEALESIRALESVAEKLGLDG